MERLRSTLSEGTVVADPPPVSAQLVTSLQFLESEELSSPAAAPRSPPIWMGRWEVGGGAGECDHAESEEGAAGGWVEGVVPGPADGGRSEAAPAPDAGLGSGSGSGSGRLPSVSEGGALEAPPMSPPPSVPSAGPADGLTRWADGEVQGLGGAGRRRAQSELGPASAQAAAGSPSRGGLQSSDSGRFSSSGEARSAERRKSDARQMDAGRDKARRELLANDGALRLSVQGEARLRGEIGARLAELREAGALGAARAYRSWGHAEAACLRTRAALLRGRCELLAAWHKQAVGWSAAEWRSIASARADGARSSSAAAELPRPPPLTRDGSSLQEWTPVEAQQTLAGLPTVPLDSLGLVPLGVLLSRHPRLSSVAAELAWLEHVRDAARARYDAELRASRVGGREVRRKLLVDAVMLCSMPDEWLSSTAPNTAEAAVGAAAAAAAAASGGASGAGGGGASGVGGGGAGNSVSLRPPTSSSSRQICPTAAWAQASIGLALLAADFPERRLVERWVRWVSGESGGPTLGGKAEAPMPSDPVAASRLVRELVAHLAEQLLSVGALPRDTLPRLRQMTVRPLQVARAEVCRGGEESQEDGSTRAHCQGRCR